MWTWDITKLATLEKGVFLHAYVIIDLFSRYVVGWMVAAKECKQARRRNLTWRNSPVGASEQAVKVTDSASSVIL